MLLYDDWDDDLDSSSYNDSPEEDYKYYDYSELFDREYFTISAGIIRVNVWDKRFSEDALVCMDPDGDRGIRDENCAFYHAGEA